MAKVIRAFIDKATDKPYNVGYDYDGSRAEELAEAGYVMAEAKTPKRPAAKKKTKKDE